MEPILTEEIIAELGLDKLPPEQKDDVIERVGNVIFQGVIVRIMEGMSEEDKEAFYDVVDKNPEGGEPVIEFLQKKVPNLADIVAEEIDSFKQQSQETLS